MILSVGTDSPKKMPEIACLTVDQLDAFRNGLLSPRERDDIERHLSDCPRCRRRLVDGYRDAHVELVAVRAPRWLKARALRLCERRRETGSSRIFGLDGRLAASLAAAAALAAGAIAVVALWKPPDPRPVPNEEIWRHEAISVPGLRTLAPEAKASEIAFGWTPVPAATSYTLTLLDGRGDIVFQQSTSKQRLTVSAALAGLQPRHPYFWYVTARLPDGMGVDSALSKVVWRQR